MGAKVRALGPYPGVAGNFRQLDVYRLAVDLADEVHRAVRGWPAFDRSTMGHQIVRAADSVGANIAEATGRWHTPDKRRLLIIARGSLMELEHWLLTAQRRGLLDRDAGERADRIGQALNGLIRRPN
jgi:four helix bundle protein